MRTFATFCTPQAPFLAISRPCPPAPIPLIRGGGAVRRTTRSSQLKHFFTLEAEDHQFPSSGLPPLVPSNCTMASNPFGSSPQGFGWGGSPSGEFGRGEQPSPSVLNLVLDTPQAGLSSAAQECLDPQVSNLENNASNSIQALDVSMSGVDLADQGNGGPQAHSSDISVSGEKATQPRAQGRSKYSNLDWDAHKPTVKALYIDQDMSLAETMKVMEKNFSFRAS